MIDSGMKVACIELLASTENIALQIIEASTHCGPAVHRHCEKGQVLSGKDLLWT